MTDRNPSTVATHPRVPRPLHDDVRPAILPTLLRELDVEAGCMGVCPFAPTERRRCFAATSPADGASATPPRGHVHKMQHPRLMAPDDSPPSSNLRGPHRTGGPPDDKAYGGDGGHQ